MKTPDSHRTLGIAGAGQLGTMMIMESRGLPIRFNVYSENDGEPALKLADKTFIGEDYKKFVDESDVVTFEFEHVNRKLLEYAESVGKLRPSLKSVELKIERHREKEFLKSHDFPVGEFMVAKNGEEALEMSKNFKKFVIKRSRGGYDGKGQYYYYDLSEFPKHSEEKFVVEKFIEYEEEASIICSRSRKNEFFYFEPSHNYNRKGILIRNSSPLQNERIISEMISISRKLMEDLDYIGVMGIEFFITPKGPLINEYAPRVHNTGHHTLMGSSYSQFEMHVRDVMDLPLFQPTTYIPSGIVNIIGMALTEKKAEDILALDNTRIYDYKKNGVRRKRKMGHVCVTSGSYDELMVKMDRVQSILYGNELDNYI
ncbi:MAG: 5-(carboxyamino)imidazole ribonucleotide synthase [Cuniculiplasma sp.]